MQKVYGSILQSIKASDFRGEGIRLAAAARVNGGIGYLWLSIDVRHSPDIFQGQTITSDEWKKYHIVAEVPREASKITYGLAYVGQGAAFIDDVSIGNSE
jgi:hypothetical protein